MIVACPSCARENRIPATRLDDRARCGSCKAALAPPERPLVVESEEDFEELVRDCPLPVVVDFWAAWCGPCRMVAPEVESLARSRAGKAIVVKVDTEALPRAAERHHVRSIPTLALFRSGRELRRVSGAMPAERIARELSI